MSGVGEREYFEKAWPRLNDVENAWDRLSGKLGIVILWWSHLETRLDMFMWSARDGDWSLRKSFEERLTIFWSEFGSRYSRDDGPRVVEQLIEANKIRNQLVHNVRHVGSMKNGQAWFMCVRPHPDFRKAEKKWLDGDKKSDEPLAFDDQQIPEETLGLMLSIIVAGLEVLREISEVSNPKP